MNTFLRISMIVGWLLTIHTCLLAQSSVTNNMGSKIPELKIDNGKYINGDKSASVSDLYRKGGLIINFWATWCLPCLKEQKRLDSLMRIYPDLSVLSTTYEDSVIVKEFFNRVGLPKSTAMVITANDTSFHKYFEHRIIPHNIWVDKKGMIKAVTGGDEINEKNIKNFLVDSNLGSIYHKNDDLTFDFRKTYHVPDSLIQFRSFISGYNERITSGQLYGGNKKGVFKRFFAWNRPIVQLLWLAHTEQQKSRINWNLIELHTSDSIRFFLPRLNLSLFKRSIYNSGGDFADNERKWMKDNAFCYELILPKEIKFSRSSEYMIKDLELFFNLKTEVKKRKMLVNVVFFNKVGASRPLNLDSDEFSELILDKGRLTIKNATVDQVLNFLSQKFEYDIPYVNKTGNTDKLNLLMNGKGGILTLQDVWNELGKLGFRKVEKKSFYPVLVIKDLTHP